MGAVLSQKSGWRSAEVDEVAVWHDPRAKSGDRVSNVRERVPSRPKGRLAGILSHVANQSTGHRSDGALGYSTVPEML